MNEAANTPGETTPPTETGRRRWTKRLLAVLLPLVVLGVVELAFRGLGLFPDTTTQLTSAGFAPGTNFFPEWEDEVELPKPEGTLRVFALGGSTTNGYGVTTPFGRLLQERLAATRPQGSVEVINGGYPAYGSHRVLAIAERAKRFEPDLLVVYMGHNEFLEDVFYDPEGLVARLERAGEFARGFRIVNGVRRLFGEQRSAVKAALPADFFGNENYPLIHSDEQVTLRVKLLALHVAGIVEAGHLVGARVIVIPAVANLLVAPGDSVHGPGVDPRSGRWSQLEQKARTQFETRDWDGLAVSCAALEKLDDRYALVHYWKGLSLMGRGDVEAGRAALIEANRQDRRGTRINPQVAEAMASSAREAGADVLLVDELFDRELEAEFRRVTAKEPQQLFIDHCHPSQKGHQLIADAIAKLLK